MAGVTNYPFRALCRRFGAGLCISEMITARPLAEGREKTLKLADFGPDESPRSLQLYGVDPYYVGEAVKRLVGEGRIDHLDLNFGCPAPKVTRNGGGAALPWKRRLLASVIGQHPRHLVVRWRSLWFPLLLGLPLAVAVVAGAANLLRAVYLSPLPIADDGQGFDPQATRSGKQVGLWSMRERVEQLGGEFELHSAPGQGTTLRENLAEALALCLDLDQPLRGLAYAERAKSRALVDLLAHRLDLSIRPRGSEDGPLVSEITTCLCTGILIPAMRATD